MCNLWGHVSSSCSCLPVCVVNVLFLARVCLGSRLVRLFKSSKRARATVLHAGWQKIFSCSPKTAHVLHWFSTPQWAPHKWNDSMGRRSKSRGQQVVGNTTLRTIIWMHTRLLPAYEGGAEDAQNRVQVRGESERHAGVPFVININIPSIYVRKPYIYPKQLSVERRHSSLL